MTERERSAVAPDDPFHLVGTLLERKYRVDRVVAEGGFGIVYAGYHLGLDAKIAIKVLRPQKKLDDDDWADLLAQFLAEAKALAKLRSASVVTVFDAGVMHIEDAPEGLPWIVLEWIEGETLAAHLDGRRGQGGRSPAEALDLLRGVITAIAEAHANGIAHRDLKPTNVMLDASKHGVTARVLDFGIAKIMEGDEAPSTGATATSAKHKAYSPAYAAPEQVSGMRTGPWTDVHALGLLLSEVLTDRAPYPTDDPNELYRSVFDPVRPTPARLGVDVGAWEAVLERALAIKPAERFASAGELLAALDAGLAETHERAPAPPTRVVLSSVPPAPPGLPFAATERSDRAVIVGRRATRRARATLVVGSAVAIAAVAGAIALGRRAPAPAPAANASASASPMCTSNAGCTAALGGQAAICASDRSRCVALASQDCTVHAERAALDDADTVWFGTLFPTSGTGAEDGVANTQAAELARRDFAQMTGGMTTQGASTKMRSFGVVACDAAADAKRAAAHLVDVGVAAVIGFQSSVEAIDLASSVFIPNGILSVSATNINPLVTTVPHPPGVPRLVWRTTYNALDTAHAMSAIVGDRLEPRVRAQNGGRPIRVALVRQKNAPGAAFADEVFRTLRYNGKTALENGGDFRELTYEADDELRGLVPELVELAPQIVLYVIPNEAAIKLFDPLEKAWRKTAPRPVCVGAAHFDPPLLDFIGDDRDRRRRFFGITVVSTMPENARFVMHYNETFAAKATLTRGPNTAYDAFYLLAYGAIAGGGRVTGASLSQSFARLLPPGRRIAVGMSGIFDAITALRAGENIDLIGSSGSLELDAKTGDAQLDQVLLCPGVDARGRATDAVESGVVYRTAQRKLEGALVCP